MLGRVVVENGVKKIVPLTADCGSGNPVGTVIAVYSNKVPNGYLPCNGVAFDTAQFPVLYALLGDNHTPDLRECTLKGIGESGRTVGAHVKTGGLAVGEFVDDRVQDFRLRTTEGAGGDGDRLSMGNVNGSQATPRIFTLSTNMRNGATTEVKAVGVNWCIKATSGINENQADNVLSALSPVDTVTSGNMHSVTSNAVASAINNYRSNIGTWFTASMKNEIVNSFNNASNYSLFWGATDSGAECGWYGFKHNNTKGGICIVMSEYYGIFLGYGGGNPSTWNYHCIIESF